MQLMTFVWREESKVNEIRFKSVYSNGQKSVLFPVWNDCAAYILNDLKTEELDAQL